MTFRIRLLFPTLMIVVLSALVYPTQVFARDAATPTPAPTDIPSDVPSTPEAPAPPLSSDPTPDPSLTPVPDPSINPLSAEIALAPGLCGDVSCVWFSAGTYTWNYENIQAALNSILSDPQKPFPIDGIIHLRDGSQTIDVTLNGITSPVLANLKGIVGTGSSLVTVNGSLEINGTNLGFTLSGFTINTTSSTPTVNIHDNKGTLTLTDLGISNIGPDPTSDAIDVSNQSGAVVITNVSASSLNGDGANINNNLTTAAYPVTIKNSEFDDNGAAALNIDTRGALTLDGVSASRSTGGLTVSNASSISIKNSFFGDSKSGDGVVLSPANLAAVTMDTVFINGNAGKGLVVNSLGGAVTLNNLSVSSNTGSGLTIGTAIAPAGAIKITNSDLNNNGSISSDWGLQAFSKSSITLAQVNASGNKGGGIKLDNCLGDGTKCAFTAPVTVTSSTGSSFSSNAGDSGIYIRSNGSVSVSDFTSTNNLNLGVDVSNAFTGSLGNVALRAVLPGWTNSILGNGFGGIKILSNGMISLDRINSSNNSGNGAFLDNSSVLTAKGVDVKNSTFNANTNLSTSTGGILINSKGTISLTNVGASGNKTIGASLFNLNGSAPVSILPGVNGIFNNFNDNGGWGINITSRGAVTVKNVNANDNVLTGLLIDNQNTPLTGVTVNNGNFNGNGSGSTGSGMEIYSLGGVNLAAITASSNAQRGAQVGFNTGAIDTPLPAFVNLTNGVFSSNAETGLTIVAKGNVTLNSITASHNGMPDAAKNQGLLVDNCVFIGGSCLGFGSVTLNGVHNTFLDNAGVGAWIDSKGSITLSNVTANNNGRQGLFLKNDRPGSSGNISIMSSSGVFNETSNNGFPDTVSIIGDLGTYSGVNATTFGNITVSRVNANGNSGLGLYLDNCISVSGNCTSAYIKTVNLSDITASGNQFQGIAISSRGAVSLTNVLAESNSFTTASISLAANSGLGETISDRLTSGGNVDTYYFQGALNQSITITTESEDFIPSLSLFDSSSTTPMAFNVGSGDPPKSQIDFVLPADGLYHITVGSTAGAGDYKISLFPSGGSAPASEIIYANGIQVVTGGIVTARNITGNNNARDGAVILSTAAITGANMNASDNGEHGINISNQYGLISNLTLTGGTALSNDKEGYNLWSYGSIILSGLTSNNSENGNGIFINQWQPIADPPNTWGYISSRPVTLSQITTSGNAAKTGLYVQASGSITLNGINSQNNHLGAYLVTIPPVGIAAGKITVQNSTGMNRISGNATDGLKIESNGAVTIDRVLARDNGGNGVNIVNSKTLIVTNSSLLYNLQNGLEATADGLVTLTNLLSIANGSSVFPGDGIKLTLSSDPVTFNGCAFLGNHGSGIEVINGSTFNLVSTSFFGNNTNAIPGLLNLWWHTLP